MALGTLAPVVQKKMEGEGSWVWWGSEWRVQRKLMCVALEHVCMLHTAALATMHWKRNSRNSCCLAVCFSCNPPARPRSPSLLPLHNHFFGQKLQEHQIGVPTARNTKTRSCNFFLPKFSASPSGKAHPGPSSRSPPAASSPGPGHALLSFHKLFLWPKVARTPSRRPHSQKHSRRTKLQEHQNSVPTARNTKTRSCNSLPTLHWQMHNEYLD